MKKSELKRATLALVALGFSVACADKDEHSQEETAEQSGSIGLISADQGEQDYQNPHSTEKLPDVLTVVRPNAQPMEAAGLTKVEPLTELSLQGAAEGPQVAETAAIGEQYGVSIMVFTSKNQLRAVRSSYIRGDFKAQSRVEGRYAVLFFSANKPKYLYTFEDPLAVRTRYFDQDGRSFELTERANEGYFNLSLPLINTDYSSASMFIVPDTIAIRSIVSDQTLADIAEKGTFITEMDLSGYYQSFPVILD